MWNNFENLTIDKRYTFSINLFYTTCSNMQKYEVNWYPGTVRRDRIYVSLSVDIIYHKIAWIYSSALFSHLTTTHKGKKLLEKINLMA